MATLNPFLEFTTSLKTSFLQLYRYFYHRAKVMTWSRDCSHEKQYIFDGTSPVQWYHKWAWFYFASKSNKQSFLI